eukprot:TRINITY_DN9300_c0_g1_i3.p2 TRINITY_DN9300_c0_g1~~TRINITY_DN9300_c0_g1_i3.p2  ORF type:complete len:200 (+),score=32.12 TRINITY_DN9300_c0_g1_i3:273-872(+)
MAFGCSAHWVLASAVGVLSLLVSEAYRLREMVHGSENEMENENANSTFGLPSYQKGADVTKFYPDDCKKKCFMGCQCDWATEQNCKKPDQGTVSNDKNVCCFLACCAGKDDVYCWKKKNGPQPPAPPPPPPPKPNSEFDQHCTVSGNTCSVKGIPLRQVICTASTPICCCSYGAGSYWVNPVMHSSHCIDGSMFKKVVR